MQRFAAMLRKRQIIWISAHYIIALGIYGIARLIADAELAGIVGYWSCVINGILLVGEGIVIAIYGGKSEKSI